MSDIDVAVGLDPAAMNQAMAVAYQQLYPKVFTGSQTVTQSGLEFDVAWDATSPPSVVLSPPNDARRLVGDHLRAHLPAHPTLSMDQIADAYVATLAPTTFQIVATGVAVTLTGGGESGTDLVDVMVNVQLESSNGTVTLHPLNATGTTANPTDTWVLNTVILPAAIAAAQQQLSPISLPPLDVADVHLTPPNAIVNPGHAVVVAALAGRPVPGPPPSDDWPGAPFFAVLSQDALGAVGRAGVQHLLGTTFGDSGSVDIGIGTARYNATATINGLGISPVGGGSSDFAFRGDVSGNVSAGIKIGCTTFGVNYTLSAAPPPRGVIGMQLDGAKVSAKTRQLETFVLLLTPNGSPVEWLLSALTVPLLQVITAAFSPLISQAFVGLTFPVMDLPSVPIDTGGVEVVIQPTDLRFSSFRGQTSIEGSALVTGG